MAAGQVGMYGQAAASRAMLEHKEDLGAALILDLEMTGNLVQERQMNNACVTRTHVRVRQIAFSFRGLRVQRKRLGFFFLSPVFFRLEMNMKTY